MPPLSSTASSAVRAWTRHSLPSNTARIAATSVQQQRKATSHTTGSSFDSPFSGPGSSETTKVPKWGDYMSKQPEISNRVFSYFVAGSMGLLAAAGAKATVQGELPILPAMHNHPGDVER